MSHTQRGMMVPERNYLIGFPITDPDLSLSFLHFVFRIDQKILSEDKGAVYMKTETLQKAVETNEDIALMIREKLPEMLKAQMLKNDPELDPEMLRFSTEEMVKNNGTKMIGIQMEKKGENLSPCIYLERYLPDHISELQEDGLWEDVVDRLTRDFQYAAEIVSPTVCLENKGSSREMFRKEEIPDHLVLSVVNREMNAETLKKGPYRSFLDLAIIMEWEIRCGGRRGCMRVSHELFEFWGQTFDELYDTALENTMRRYPERIEKLDEVIKNIFSGHGNMDPCQFLPGPSPFYYCGTDNGLSGSVAVIYPGIGKRIYETVGEAYYLIPSSMDELLAIPVGFTSDPEQEEGSGEESPADRLKEIIQEVNTEVLNRTEILSDSLYYYSVEEDRFEIVQ